MPLVGGLPPLEEAAVEARSELLTQEEPTREGKGGEHFRSKGSIEKTVGGKA